MNAVMTIEPRGREAAAWHLASPASFGICTRGRGSVGGSICSVYLQRESRWPGSYKLVHLMMPWFLAVIDCGQTG
jgi:hypothetical protein